MSSPSYLNLPEIYKKLLFFAAVIILGSYCLFLIRASVNPPLPGLGEPPSLYSNQSQQDLRLTFVDAIRQAKQSIHLVMFGLSDAAILSALSQRLQDRLPLSIYYDAGESPRIRSQLKGADLHPVRISGLMHQKIMVLDRDLVFIGSANMTESSLRMHDNLVVGMRSQKMAQFLLDRIPSSSGYLRTMVGGQDVELWLLPDPRGVALTDLRRMLQKSSRSIKIALFTFTHPSLCDEVISAHERGIDVTLVVDLHSGLGASAKAVDQLRQKGVKVLYSQGVQLLHHKFVWIDDETLICGSANWTKAAFKKNSDCILALHHLTPDQKEFMRCLWHRIESEARKIE